MIFKNKKVFRRGQPSAHESTDSKGIGRNLEDQVACNGKTHYDPETNAFFMARFLKGIQYLPQMFCVKKMKAF
jgi:hypothetical protein